MRTATILAVGIALLPSDRAQQQDLYKRAALATNWVVTFCDRNAQTCEQGARAWDVFVAKAQFGAELALDMVREGQTIRSESAADAPIAPASLERGSGTLTPGDRLPAWRGKHRTNGSI